MSIKKRQAEIFPKLEEWKKRHDELDSIFESMKAVTGSGVDSPLWACVWSLWEAYTKGVERDVCDDFDFLSWYNYDNDMGKKALPVFSPGGREKKIKTLKDLAYVIAGGMDK